MDLRLDQARACGERVDFLTFVPDGEPTLDTNLGTAIELLKPHGIPIAVISNASMLWREDTRAMLASADWVSLKIDTAEERLWRRINRPSPALRFRTILAGMRRFTARFRGTLVTETMLLSGYNDTETSVGATARLVAELEPHTAYLAVPTRPTAEEVRSPDAVTLVRAHETLRDAIGRVELLTGYEGDRFAFTGDATCDLLATTAVHPMRESAVRDLLARAGEDWSLVTRLLDEKRLERVHYRGMDYFLRLWRQPGTGENDA